MPGVFRFRGFRFYEGDPREPQHIRVMKDGIDAKFWLWPDVLLAYNDGFSAKTLRELAEILQQRREEIGSAWNEYFGEG